MNFFNKGGRLIISRFEISLAAGFSTVLRPIARLIMLREHPHFPLYFEYVKERFFSILIFRVTDVVTLAIIAPVNFQVPVPSPAHHHI